MEILDTEQISALISIILADLALAGDNALLVGMVARSVPKELRNRTIFWGVFGAVIFRITFAFFAFQLMRIPELLIVGQPTRGVDIGAIEFIHKRLIQLRDSGKAVLLISVELDEILSLSDRILVMFDGKIMGEREAKNTNEKELGLLMAGVG